MMNKKNKNNNDVNKEPPPVKGPDGFSVSLTRVKERKRIDCLLPLTAAE